MNIQCADRKIQIIGRRVVLILVNLPFIEGVSEGDIRTIQRLTALNQKTVDILFYRHWSPFYTVLAKSDVGGTKMWLNLWQMNRSDASLSGTVAHELTHVMGYVHCGNKPTGDNLLTVPFLVGKKVKEIYEKLYGG